MSFASLADVRGALQTSHSKEPPEWRKKMLHLVPDLPYVADRTRYLVEKCVGESVVDFGCTGVISLAIQKVAEEYHGVDKLPVTGAQLLDLDAQPDLIQVWPGVTLLMAAEILEHLANPGRFLKALQDFYPGVPLWVTVPQAGAYMLRDGTHEMVNPDHVAWYSYTTLKTLLGRYGYSIDTARWYGGKPTLPEGLIVKAV